MKKTTPFLAFLFMALGLHTNAQVWSELNSGSAAMLYGCHFINPNVAHFVGSGGEIIRTQNGGATFNSYFSGTSDFFDVFFTDENTGYVVGDNGKILKTTDGGDSWQPQNSHTQAGLRCVRFIDDNVGFVLGGDCTVLRTNDGGATWVEQVTPGNVDNTVYGIDFPSTGNYVASGRFGRIYHSTDAGQHWTGTTITSEVLLDVLFLTPTTGFVIGSNSFLQKTTDGGYSWSPVPTGTTSLYFAGMSFANANLGFIAGGNVTQNMGTITSTHNGGNTWDTEYTGTTRLYDVHVTSKVGYACGVDGAILKYTPSGLAINETGEPENPMAIYPNPANDFTILVLPENQKAIRLTVTDYTGRTVKQLAVNGVSPVQLSTQDLAAGQYVVQVLTQQGTSYAQRFLVQH